MVRLTDAKSDVPWDGPAPGCELSVSYLSGLIGNLQLPHTEFPGIR